jgi:hypothetical protein
MVQDQERGLKWVITARGRNDCNGSSFDEFLREEGTLEETVAVAIKRVLEWQLQQDRQ